MIAIVWLGLFPQPVLNTAEPFLKSLRQSASMMRVAAPAGEQGTANSSGLPRKDMMVVTRPGKSDHGGTP